MTNATPSFHVPRILSRRDVLRTMLFGAGIYALGPLGRGVSEALGAPRANFKRLVVLNLVGGCDTLNLVVPVSLSSYYAARGTLAIPSSTALALNGTSAYRLHPSMTRTQGLWNAGQAAAVQRVGYPNEDLSHFVSQDVFSLGVRNDFSTVGIKRSGWIARFADNYAPTALGAVSIGMGRPLDFTGGATSTLTVGSLAGMQILNGDATRVQAMKDLVHNAPAPGLSYDAKAALSAAYDLSDQVQAAATNHASYLATSGITWPNTSIANRLKDVAGIIYGGFETRIFYTGFGNEGAAFDTHASQAYTQTTLFSQLDAALGAFADEMIALGVWNDIVVVVITEFGRRTASNGSGTDHGHAFAELVLGGAVHGGSSYGPDLTNADLTRVQGYPAFAVDFRSIYKELVRDHLGANPAPIFPEYMPIETDLNLV
jgi:uncharacterized protein (DUF1501 family)